MQRTLPRRTIRATPAFLIAVVLLCAFVGCWETIEYTGPDPSEAAVPRASAPDAEVVDGGKVAEIEATDEPQPELPASEPEAAPTKLADESIVAAAVEAAIAGSSGEAAPEVDQYALPSEPAVSVAEAVPVAEETAQSAAEVEAPSDSTPVDNAATTESPNTRLAAWTLGRELSLAALANDRGVAAKSAEKWLAEARAAAESLGTSVNDLPARPATIDDVPASSQVLNYLFVDGQRIGHDLQTRYGADHTALFEVAVKSSLLIVLYNPGSTAVESISKAISQAAPHAELPAELWQPLVELLGKQSTIEDVRAGVRRLHADVDRYLAAPVE